MATTKKSFIKFEASGKPAKASEQHARLATHFLCVKLDKLSK